MKKIKEYYNDLWERQEIEYSYKGFKVIYIRKEYDAFISKYYLIEAYDNHGHYYPMGNQYGENQKDIKRFINIELLQNGKYKHYNDLYYVPKESKINPILNVTELL